MTATESMDQDFIAEFDRSEQEDKERRAAIAPEAAEAPETTPAYDLPSAEQVQASRRRVAVTRRCELAGMEQGWGSECYVLVTPTTPGEFREFKRMNADSMKEDEGIEFMLNFVKKHFVAGKLQFVDDNGDPYLDKMVEADLDDLSIEITSKIFATVTGQKYDPKAFQKAAEDATKRTQSANSSAITSSTN